MHDSRKDHWETIYTTRDVTDVGWYQADPQISLRLISEVSSCRSSVIDVGGGASVLVDRLLEQGHERVAVLDISAAALEHSKARVGDRARRVEWHVGDVTSVADVGRFDVWHDRAV